MRAWPGGTGDCKVGGNYAPTIAPQEDAAQRGFNQVLWLFGEEQEVTEVGTMNLFFHMRGEDGVNELVTAPLNDIVLPGVTRDSIIHLARQNNIRVSERRQTMKQLIAAMDAGRVLEAFGAGTACVVSPVKEINFKGTAYDIPLGKEPGSKSGPMAQFFWDELTKIQVRAGERRCFWKYHFYYLPYSLSVKNTTTFNYDFNVDSKRLTYAQYGEVADHPWSVKV